MYVLSDRSFEELAIHPNGTVNTSYRPLVLSMYDQFVRKCNQKVIKAKIISKCSPFSCDLVRWLEVFPKEQLLLVNGDQLIEDPLTQVRRIEDFLGEILIIVALDIRNVDEREQNEFNLSLSHFPNHRN